MSAEPCHLCRLNPCAAGPLRWCDHCLTARDFGIVEIVGGGAAFHGSAVDPKSAEWGARQARREALRAGMTTPDEF